MAKIKAKKSIEIVEKNEEKIKETKYISEEAAEVRKFIIILLVFLVIILGIYFLTKVFVSKEDTPVNDEVQTGIVSYDVVSVGMILNRPYDDYYVIVYDAEETDAVMYSAIINNYQAKDTAKKIYFCDLGNELNKSYVSKTGEGNKDAKTTDEFNFGKLTLLQIKNGKITKYIEDLDSIKDTLQ